MRKVWVWTVTVFCVLVPMSDAFSSPYSTPDGIWIMNRDGTEPRRVTNLRGPFDVGPVTDHLVVAGGDYNSNYGNQRDIYLVALDGSEEKNLTNSSEYELSPQWSPNGEQIALIRYLQSPYTNSSPEEDATLWVMNADGSELEQVAHISDADINETRWSPDGNRIAFSAIGDEDEAYVVDPDGQDLQRLIESGPNSSLSWSPDSEELAFVAEDWSLKAVDVQTGIERTILGGGDEQAVRLAGWAPFGDLILFARSQGLFTVERDGSNELPLSHDYAYGADWSPDGKDIAFSSFSISVVDLQTRTVDSLTRDDEAYEPMEEAPAWTADGSRIIFFRSVWQGVPQTFRTTRTLSSRMVDGTIVRGRLLSDSEACFAQVPIRLEWKRERTQQWKTLVKYRTQKSGTVSWPVPEPHGFYRLIAPRLERQVGFDTAVCRRVIGRVLRL